MHVRLLTLQRSRAPVRHSESTFRVGRYGRVLSLLSMKLSALNSQTNLIETSKERFNRSTDEIQGHIHVVSRHHPRDVWIYEHRQVEIVQNISCLRLNTREAARRASSCQITIAVQIPNALPHFASCSTSCVSSYPHRLYDRESQWIFSSVKSISPITLFVGRRVTAPTLSLETRKREAVCALLI